MKISLAEEPFEVAVAHDTDAPIAQRRLLFPVALRIGTMTRKTVVAVKQCTRRSRFGLARHWVDVSVVLGWNPFKPFLDGRRERKGHTEGKCGWNQKSLAAN